MVVSDAALATHAGVEILDQGGNAIDAAVATAFALAVCYPEAGNLGGGGFLVANLADGKSIALDFREKAPLAATRDMYIDPAGNVSEDSRLGHRASGVPGSVAGLWEAHRKYGSLPWKQVLLPALRLARDGFTVDTRMARSLHSDSSRLALFQGSRELFLAGGKTPAEGSVWKNVDLARAIERIADQGKDGFYGGPIADMIVAEMKRGGGIITLQDLASYQAVWRTPVTISYRGKTIVSMPPPSSGGVTLALICNILDGFNLRSAGWHSARSLHITAEAMRRAFAVRNEFLGDPDAVRIPMDSLLSPGFALALRQSISPDRATPSSAISVKREHLRKESGQTTHLSTVDARGNAVALTTTLNGLHGSGVTVEGAGFLLNNEMDDFASKPGTPNMFGLVQGEANAIAPGKRILSSMTPTIVLDSLGSVFLVTGARGGPYIITAVFQIMSNIVDYGMDLPEAVVAPRIHHQHLPDQIEWEDTAMSGEVPKQLEEFGHSLRAAGALGSASSILRANNRWFGFSDPRTGGRAEGQSRLP
jgi:gamma-glutamyltranspeptidase / glutathione hydrolase